MRYWLGKLLCLVAALAVADVPLVLVQGVAWTTMMQDRAPQRGVAEALESTFSGHEPCPMCHAVQEQKSEQQEEAPVPEAQTAAKWIPVHASEEVCLFRPGVLFVGLRTSGEPGYRSRSDMPECPPPERVS